MSARILVGDTIEQMATLAPCSIHVSVASPPYWGLRDYGLPKREWPEVRFRLNEWVPETVVPAMLCCLGLEPDPVSFVAHLILVYREVRRVLRDDGLCWVNLGDSFTAAGGSGKGGGTGRRGRSHQQRNIRPDGLTLATKPGDLLGVPWLFAAAMRADGWHFRGDEIWCKRSPMPESLDGVNWRRCKQKTGRRVPVLQGGLSSWDMGDHTHGPSSGEYRGQEKTVAEWADCPGCPKCEATNGLVLRRGSWRHTRGHEYVFQFAKSPKYFADAQAIAELTSGGAHLRGNKVAPPKEAANAAAGNGHEHFDAFTPDPVTHRNPRSFTVLSTEPSKEKHFAAYPTKLIEPLIKASVSSAGYCAACGEPVVRVIEKRRTPTRPGLNPKDWKADDFDTTQQRSKASPNRDPLRHVSETVTLSWRQTCGCQFESQVVLPGVVLDPFLGTGTTLVVAERLGLNGIGCELNPEYAEIAKRRIANAHNVKPSKPHRRRVVQLESSLFDLTA